jgi:hypothetical protein
MAGAAVALLVLVGAFTIRQRQSEGLHFARALPSWHQLTDDDVRSDAGTSEATVLHRYTRQPVQEGQAVRPEDLGPTLPDAALDESAVLVLPSVNALASELHAGDIVTLRVLATQIRICPVRILEVRTEQNAPPRAVVAMPNAQAASLGSVKDEALLVALRVWGYAEGAQQPNTTELCR